eukprot:819477-Prorocentrum_minimum.AAC.1
MPGGEGRGGEVFSPAGAAAGCAGTGRYWGLKGVTMTGPWISSGTRVMNSGTVPYSGCASPRPRRRSRQKQKSHRKSIDPTTESPETQSRESNPVLDGGVPSVKTSSGETARNARIASPRRTICMITP